MKVVVEMSLSNRKGESIGMGSPKSHAKLELEIEEWVGGNSNFSEEYVIVKDSDGEHLFKVRMGTKGQVYIDIPGDPINIITVRGEQ